MRKMLILAICLVGVLTACGEKDVYDMMRESRQAEFERRQNMTQEERDAEDQAIKEAEEKKEQKRIAEQERREQQEQWEKENTDLIYYSVNRYSEDGKFFVEGKYTLTLASSGDMEVHDFENRGYNEALDNNIIIADSTFFEFGPPSGKFDIYYVVWEKGSREKAVRVGLAYRSISRGW